MLKKIVIISIILSIIFNCYSVNIKYYNLEKDNNTKKLIDDIIDIISKKDIKKFNNLIGNNIQIRAPLRPTYITLNKSDFIKNFNNNDYKNLSSVSYFYGVLFDDKYAKNEYSVKSYNSNKDYDIAIYKSKFTDCAFGISLYQGKIDLVSISFDFNKDGKIIVISTDFQFLNKPNSDNEKFLIIAKNTYLYDSENLDKKIINLLRNEEIEIIKYMEKSFENKKDYYKDKQDIDFLSRPSYVNYIYVPRLNKKGYILDSDYIVLPKEYEFLSEEDMENWFP